ncbi:MAG TPA: oligosaccharide flippase family protein, partial [Bacteroidia bacterium]|nr:oligosaccharide flippase family protein [Bacteroidia bacterium]
MSDFKGIIKSTSVYTFLGFLPLAFGFFITPLYTYYLSKEQLGEVNLFNTLATTFLLFYSMSVDASFGNLYFENFNNKKKLQLLFGTTLSLALIFSIGGISIILLLGKYIFPLFLRSSALYTSPPVVYYLALMPFCNLLYNIFIALYRNEQKILRYSILNISALVGMTIGTLTGIIYLNMGSLGAIAGKTIGYGFFILIFLVSYLLSNGLRFNMIYAKRILTYGLPIFLYLSLGQVSSITDRIMIEHFFDLSQLGVYGLAIVIASVAEIWIGAVSNAVSPVIYRYIKTGVEENTKKLQFLFKIQYISVILIICLIIALVKPLTDTIISEKFREVVYF